MPDKPSQSSLGRAERRSPPVPSRRALQRVLFGLVLAVSTLTTHVARVVAQAPSPASPQTPDAGQTGAVTTPSAGAHVPAAPAMTEPAPGVAPPAAGGTAPDAHTHDVTELSKQTQNPVADLVSLPFQFNFNNGGGLRDQTQVVLNFQPVLPIHLGSKVNLIARTVLPIVSTPNANGGRERGLGDAQEQLYFAPAKKGLFTWGVGPILSLPIATVPALASGAWGVGPGGLFVINAGPFVLGGLVNQVWTIKDNAGRPRVNAFTAQPFINYNFAQGWAVGLAPVVTANWDANKGDTWTLPLGVGVTKTLVFNRRPMVLGFQYYRNVVRPDAAPTNQLRVVMNFLFPG